MDAEANAALVRRFFETVVNARKTETFSEFMAPGYQLHLAGNPEPLDRAGHLLFDTELHTAFPDWRDEVVDLVAAGDRVASRVVSTGTHDAPFHGIAATGRRVTIESVNIDRFEHGLIVERWLVVDLLSFYQQLDAFPATR